VKKVALITAASRGIGAACARELAARDYQLVLMATSPTVETLAAELDAVAYRGSITVAADLENVVKLAQTKFNRLDAVVINTGHPAKGPLLALTDQQWQQGLDLLLLNVIRLARQVIPLMQQQGGGAIVNISSLTAREPNRQFPISSVMRAGLGALTKMLADEYAAANIRINTVLPGFVDSHPISEELRQRIPLQRNGLVAELAKTVAFLLSSDAGYITGESLRVDGGLGRGI
jgi:NAD(P)-dependent dehydrogenase (short-subunit alcohol dehydrogenase family)